MDTSKEVIDQLLKEMRDIRMKVLELNPTFRDMKYFRYKPNNPDIPWQAKDRFEGAIKERKHLQQEHLKRKNKIMRIMEREQAL